MVHFPDFFSLVILHILVYSFNDGHCIKTYLITYILILYRVKYNKGSIENIK